MKKTILSFCVAFATIVTLHAQQISVVSQNGQTTTVYNDLNLALQGAAAGSTVYLPGGGLRANDSVKINRQLTIIGIGHRTGNDNADGVTIIEGNLNFVTGANNSVLMGVYLTGDVNIGVVNNFLLRYCNINGVQVGHHECQGVVINQNYIRSLSEGGNSPIHFTNNIINGLQSLNGGLVEHNIFLPTNYTMGYIYNSQIKNNISSETWVFVHYGGGNYVSNNTARIECGDNQITWDDDMFIGPNNGINPTSNFHLKSGAPGKNAGTDGTDIGIYGGSGFNDSALPPTPRIVSKSVAETTDESGKLKVQVRVKAK